MAAGAMAVQREKVLTLLSSQSQLSRACFCRKSCKALYFRSNKNMFNKEEAVAKLLRARKSMILAPVLRASKLARAAQTRPCPKGQARLRSENWRQKGDFMGRMSFAIAS